MRKINRYLFFALIILSVFVHLKSSVYKTGRVIDKRTVKRTEHLTIEEVKVKSGIYIINANNFLWDEENYNTELKENDRVWFRVDKYGKIICGYRRDFYSYGLIVFTFILLFVFLGKKRGWSLFSILINFFIFLFIFIPLLKNGLNPVIAVFVFSIIASAIAIILNQGLKRQAFVSFLTVISSVVMSLAFIRVIVRYLKLSGVFAVNSRRVVMAIHSLGWKIENLQGLLISVFLLASLGAIIDASVCLTSSASEILKSNISISDKKLFLSLKNIWKKIFSMMTGGILFVYFGSGISFFFLVHILGIPLIRIINWEFISILISGGIISSMGLIFVIPSIRIYLKFLRV